MMRRRLVQMAWMAALCLATWSCGSGSGAPDLTELQHVRARDIDVVLLASGEALKQKDLATLEFRSGGRLVDVGAVTVSATMAMGSGMPPMMGSSFVKKTDTPGRYQLETDMSMAGAWRLDISWDGPAGKGMVTMPGTVR